MLLKDGLLLATRILLHNGILLSLWLLQVKLVGDTLSSLTLTTTLFVPKQGLKASTNLCSLNLYGSGNSKLFTL
jgi:hypothetical protein